METMDAIAGRRTVRDFDGRPVDRRILEQLLEAGFKAPSNDHLRSWEFISVDSPRDRANLLQPIQGARTASQIEAWLDSWNSTDPLQRALYLDAVPKQHRMLLQAGALLLPCFRQPCPLLKPASLNDLNAFASIWCCIENILLAASDLGIQGVVRIPFEDELPHLYQVLGVPEGWVIPCYLALGYPAAGVPLPRQIERRASEHLHFGRWGRRSPEESRPASFRELLRLWGVPMRTVDGEPVNSLAQFLGVQHLCR